MFFFEIYRFKKIDAFIQKMLFEARKSNIKLTIVDIATMNHIMRFNYYHVIRKKQGYVFLRENVKRLTLYEEKEEFVDRAFDYFESIAEKDVLYNRDYVRILDDNFVMDYRKGIIVYLFLILVMIVLSIGFLGCFIGFVASFIGFLLESVLFYLFLLVVLFLLMNGTMYLLYSFLYRKMRKK